MFLEEYRKSAFSPPRFGNELATVTELGELQSGTDSPESEGGVGQNTPEPQEATCGTRHEVLAHRYSPVRPADVFALRVPSNVNDEACDDETDDGDRLDGAEEELGLSEETYGSEVDEDDENAEDGDEDGLLTCPDCQSNEAMCHNVKTPTGLRSGLQ